MSNFKLHGRKIDGIFQLIGYKENDISKSIAWVLKESKTMLMIFLEETCGIQKFKREDVEISLQENEKGFGITDIEIRDNKEFFIIIEAKKGWELPKKNQLSMYASKDSFVKSSAKVKQIITLSECSKEYAEHYLEIKVSNGFTITHLSWKDINRYAERAYSLANSNTEKTLLRELQLYLKGLVTMQNHNSNEVYVVSLGKGGPEECELTWIDIVKKNKKYFHPLGGNGWPKEPPNYIAFRYSGKLQSIHHIDKYVVKRNPHSEIKEMPDKEWSQPHFIYSLGPVIKPLKEVKTGEINRATRVWCHLDTLLTSNTISEARDLTKKRMSE